MPCAGQHQWVTGLRCFHFISGLIWFITWASIIFFNGGETLCDGSGAAVWRGFSASTSTCQNECIIRLWFPGSCRTGRKNLLLRCHLLSVCTPAWPGHFICCFLFAECMLSICYVNSRYNSCAKGITFYKSRVQREWQRMNFYKTAAATR